MSGEQLTPNFNSRNSSDAYKRLDESLALSPDAQKLAIDEAEGTLDDNTDIAEPNYNDAETRQIETELAQADGLNLASENTSDPQDPALETEKISFAIENPSDPNPF